LNRSKRQSHRRKRRSFIGQLIHDINKSFRNLRSGFSSKPKEYRPYLGPQDKPKHAGLETAKSLNPETGEETHKGYERISHRRKRSTLGNRIRRFLRNRELSREQKSKRKYKQKIKKRHKQEFRKRSRIDFIRKFLPEYKRGKKHRPYNPDFAEEESAETKKQHQKNYFIYTINSTALYIIAYLIVYMMYQLTVLIVASNWDLDSVLLYYDLAFNDYSPLWKRFNIIIVTFSGPLISLLIGVLFLKVFVNRPKVKGFIKLFFIWIALHALNLFFGAFSSGVSFDEGFGYVAAWIYLNIFWQIFISLIFLFILGLIGYYSASRFLETTNSIHRIRKENRLKFLLYQVILPWLIGGLIIFLVKLPNNMPYDTGNLITMVVAVIPVLLNRHARPNITFKGERRPTRINWFYVVLFVVLILAWRIGLNSGLLVDLNYEFIFELEVKSY